MASTVPVGEARAQAEQLYRSSDAQKVMVRFKAIGNAPIMKTNDFRISAFNKFLAVTQFLRKELGLRKNDQIVCAAPANTFADHQYLYINASFAPSPEETVGNLYRYFATERHLIVNYSTTPAWG